MNEQESKNAVVNPNAEEARIRELMLSAGPRPDVPDEVLAGLRGAAEGQWRQLVEMERQRARFARRNTVLALAASLLLAVALGWWLMPEWKAQSPDLVASLELVHGTVLADGSHAAISEKLAAGSVLETGGGQSGAALRLIGGQSFRLDEGTRVKLLSASSFELERGAIYVDTHRSDKGAGVAIVTGFGVVRDIGTQFSVRLGGNGSSRLQVMVREGAVEIERGAVRHSAGAGERLTVPAGSDAVETAAIERHGPGWDWVEEVAPAISIDGARLSEYLEWVARETGRELRYADSELAQSARAIILSGSIAGFTPEESLTILPASGLGHRIENGWLLIEQRP